MSEPFFFGIPLIARAVAGDWKLVEHLFGLTLRSVLAQTEADFRVILAAHDVPAPWRRVAHDPRFQLARADWAPEPPTAANDDGGRKKWLIKQLVRSAGGGLLMFLDGDDWVARDLVHRSREAMSPHDVGAILADGLALDYESLRIAPFPIAGAFDGPFHGLCGSSTIGRIVPNSANPLHLDPHEALGAHHEWEERALRDSLPIGRVQARAVYMVGTGQNHSESQGPFADWRGHVTRAVRRHGTPLVDELAYEFGQDILQVHANLAP